METHRIDWDAAGAGAICGIAYAIPLAGIALLAAGGGHGSYMPFVVFGAPASLIPGPWVLLAVLLVWPFAGAVAGGAARSWWPLTLLSVHTAAAAASVLWGNPAESADEQWRYLSHALRLTGGWIPAGFAFYALGQMAAWVFVITALRRRSVAASASFD